MPATIALRAVFGQDEANHGTRRYRVGPDGVVRVPPEVAVHLLKNGGFATAGDPPAPHPRSEGAGEQPSQTDKSVGGGEQSKNMRALGS